MVSLMDLRKQSSDHPPTHEKFLPSLDRANQAFSLEVSLQILESGELELLLELSLSCLVELLVVAASTTTAIGLLVLFFNSGLDDVAEDCGLESESGLASDFVVEELDVVVDGLPKQVPVSSIFGLSCAVGSDTVVFQSYDGLLWLWSLASTVLILPYLLVPMVLACLA